MATGDLKGCLRKLHQQLRSLNYDRDVDYAGLARGDPASLLPILSHAFISYSSYLAEHLVGCRVELAGKNDLRFIETVYKVLRDEFHYKPVLSKQQILQCGYAERKINILCDIIGFVTKKHKELAHLDKAAIENVQLKSLELQLAECQNKLQKLLVMEERLKAVEQEMTGKVIIDRKDWNNLVSRVVLLETELILRSRKVSSMAIFTLLLFSEWIQCQDTYLGVLFWGKENPL
ncbi:UNVERIFIED_CONTAM: hypothetical protein FKN15_048257 [Acipenser sinensis]